MTLVKDPGWVIHSYLIIRLKSRWVALCISVDMGVSSVGRFHSWEMGWEAGTWGKPKYQECASLFFGTVQIL